MPKTPISVRLSDSALKNAEIIQESERVDRTQAIQQALGTLADIIQSSGVHRRTYCKFYVQCAADDNGAFKVISSEGEVSYLRKADMLTACRSASIYVQANQHDVDKLGADWQFTTPSPGADLHPFLKQVVEQMAPAYWQHGRLVATTE